ncbi:hypothetical protein QFZ68_006224 [Streptomyces sp. V1I6]|nr:hypothetical protein [Streptomyces sp. V1I6]
MRLPMAAQPTLQLCQLASLPPAPCKGRPSFSAPGRDSARDRARGAQHRQRPGADADDVGVHTIGLLPTCRRRRSSDHAPCARSLARPGLPLTPGSSETVGAFRPAPGIPEPWARSAPPRRGRQTADQYPQGRRARTAARATTPDERGDLAKSGGHPCRTLPLTAAARPWRPPAARALRSGPGPVARARSFRSAPSGRSAEALGGSAPAGARPGAQDVDETADDGRRRDAVRSPPDPGPRVGATARHDPAPPQPTDDRGRSGRHGGPRRLGCAWAGSPRTAVAPSGVRHACRTLPRLSPDVAAAARRSSGQDEQRAMKR